MELLPASLHLFNQTPHPRHLLVGGAQPQLLLVLQALAKMQNSFEREMESHVLKIYVLAGKALSPAKPAT